MSQETPYWFYNEDAPPGLPDCDDIVSKIDFNSPRGWFAYPSEVPPVCWVKHGNSVYWNEVLSQDMANVGFAAIGSDVRAPAVYFAFQCESTTIIVMEYIEGRTVEDAWAGADDSERAKIVDGVAGALRALIQIPIGASRVPSAIDGGRIRHRFFSDQLAPRHYENVEQLQEHINLFLQKSTSRKYTALQCSNLSDEPMLYCFSDIHPANFMIDVNGGIVVVDFAETSILPASFVLCRIHSNRLAFDVKQLVTIPGASFDNMCALGLAGRRITIGAGSFASMGRRVRGEMGRHSRDSSIVFKRVGGKRFRRMTDVRGIGEGWDMTENGSLDGNT